jgi:hypothetical protein
VMVLADILGLKKESFHFRTYMEKTLGKGI